MNIFFEVQGYIFETLLEAQKWNEENKQTEIINTISTDRDFNEFYCKYEKSMEKGNSIIDSLEYALHF